MDIGVQLGLSVDKALRALDSVAKKADAVIKTVSKPIDFNIKTTQVQSAVADIASRVQRIQLSPQLDTSGLLKSLNIPQQAVKKLSDEIEKPHDLHIDTQEAAGAIKGLETEILQVTQSGSALSRLFNFSLLTQGINTVASAAQSLSAPFIALDTQVQNIGTLGVANFEQFADLATDLSKKVPDSAAGIAAGVYNAISAGITGTNEQITAFVETASKVAVAGISDTNTAVNALTSVMNAYKLSVDKAGSVSDTFFAAIKLGKTSFPEMSAALANVIPAASAAGVKFDEIAASIAQMTALGVPTAQASTQIRAALVELQKPAKPLADVLKRAGLSASTMGAQLAKSAADGGGYINTLQRVEKAAKEMGFSLTQVFGSSEAASAALLVTGENAARAVDTFQKTQAEIANNAATGAYEVAAQGIEVKTKIILNRVQAVFNDFFSTIGSGATTALSAVAQLAPTVGTLASLQTLVPDGAFKSLTDNLDGVKGQLSSLPGKILAPFEKVSSSLQELPSKALTAFKSFPGAVATQLKSIPGVLSSAFSTAKTAVSGALSSGLASVKSFATSAGSALKAVPSAFSSGISALKNISFDSIKSVFVGGFTAIGSAARAMWAAVTGPVGLVIASIALVGLALYALYKNSDAIRQGIAKVMDFLAQAWEAAKPTLEDIGELLSDIASFVGDVLVFAFQTWYNIIATVVGAIVKFVSNLLGFKSASVQMSSALDILKGAFAAVSRVVATLQQYMAGIREVFNVVTAAIGDFVEKLQSGSIIGALKSLVSAFGSFGEEASAAFAKGVNNKKAEQALEALQEKTGKLFEQKIEEFGKSAETMTLEQVQQGTSGLLKMLENQKSIHALSEQQYTDYVARVQAIQQQAIAKQSQAQQGQQEAAMAAQKQADEKALRQLEDAQKEFDKIHEEHTQLRAKVATSAIDDELSRKEQELQDQHSTEIRALDTRQKELEAKEKEYSGNAKKLVQQSLQELTGIRSQKEAQLQTALQKLRDEYAKKEQAERLKLEIDTLKLRQEAITGATAAETAQRLELKRQELEKQRELELSSIDENAKNKQQLELNIRSKYNAELQKLDTELMNARARAEIATISDATEQEKELRIQGVKETLQKQLEDAGDNEQRRIQIIRDAEAQIFDIKFDYAKKTNAVLEQSMLFQQALVESFSKQRDRSEDEKLKRQIEDIKKEESALFDSFQKRQTEYTDYITKTQELGRRRAELEQQLSEGSASFFKELADRASEAFGVLAEANQRKTTEAIGRLADDVKSSMEEQKVDTLAGLFDVISGSEQMSSVITGTMQTAAAGILQLAAAGEKRVGAYLGSIGKLVLKTVQDIILANIPAIYATAASMLGPIAGPIAATLAIGAITALLSTAQGALGKYKDGVIDIKRNPSVHPTGRDTIPAMLDEGESVMRRDITQRERPILKFLHNGGTSLEYFNRYLRPDVERSVERHSVERLYTSVERVRREMLERSERYFVTAEGRLVERVSQRVNSVRVVSREYFNVQRIAQTEYRLTERISRHLDHIHRTTNKNTVQRLQQRFPTHAAATRRAVRADRAQIGLLSAMRGELQNVRGALQQAQLELAEIRRNGNRSLHHQREQMKYDQTQRNNTVVQVNISNSYQSLSL